MMRRIWGRRHAKPPAWGTGAPPPDAADFQPDARALEDRPLPPVARSTLYVLVALLLSGIAWAAWAEVDRIVVAEGRIVTATPLIVVQPLETGTIRSIDVRPGDTVRKGQLLATLDPTFAEAARDELEERERQMTAEAARLEAELSGQTFAPEDRSPEAQLQVRIAASRTAEREARLSGFSADAARLRTVMLASIAEERALREQLRLSQEVEVMRRELMDREAGSRMLYLQAQFERVGIETELDRLIARRAQTQQELAASLAARDSFEMGWRREASERLAELDRDLASLRQQLRAASRRSAAVELRAPADGVVLELARRSVGSVAAQAEPLMTLVPLDVPLEAEVQVATQDIGRIRPGQDASIKFEALPFQTHGTAGATIRIVSEDAVELRGEGAQGPPVYRARLDVDMAALRNVPASFRLMPGLRVTAEIHVGRRTVLSYLLSPVTRLFDESLREP